MGGILVISVVRPVGMGVSRLVISRVACDVTYALRVVISFSPMDTQTDEIREQMQRRLDELDTERERVASALAALGGGVAAVQVAGSIRRRHRGGPTTSSEPKALEFIRANPGVTGSQLGPAIGLSLSAGYRVLNKLRGEGLVVELPMGGWGPAPEAGVGEDADAA